MGDRFHFEGNFSGSNINIKSQLNNVVQTAGQIPAGDEADRRELQRLIAELSKELEKTPPENHENAEAVSATATTLVEQASAEKPNRTLIEATGRVLKETAKTLAEVSPAIINIVSQIVTMVAKLHGF